MPERHPSISKLAWRVAGRVRDQLHRLALNRLLDVRHEYRELSTFLDRWRKASRSIDRVSQRRWADGLANLRRNLDSLFTDLQRELANARRLTERWEPLAIPTLRELMADLDQLEDEFGGWEYKAQVLSVTTEPITLEDLYLGPFAIKLSIDRLAVAGHKCAYQIEALEPNPAAGSSHVPHPHVSDGNLCEGEASIPIRIALEQGRLADFFLLVRSVLTTYNPGSPYVALDRWDGGILCHECGSSVDDDDRCFCDRCDHDFCGECTSRCEGCESCYCAGCMSMCPQCENSVCQDCLRTCDECNEAVCVDCLENGNCPTCREKHHESNEDFEDDDEDGGGGGGGGGSENEPEGKVADTDGAGPDAAVHTVRVGEAAGAA